LTLDIIDNEASPILVAEFLNINSGVESLDQMNKDTKKQHHSGL
jgi:hypothetical protein